MADIIRPIEPFELTQGFGERPEVYKQFGMKGHNGWDFRTKFPDTPQGRRYILASWNMSFYRQGNDPGGYGLFFETVCQLYSTWKLTFAHCHSVEVFAQKKEGENMAISDNTGFSTASHLHMTPKRIKIVNGKHVVQNYNNGYFGAVNPQEYFDEVRKYKKSGANVKPPPDTTMDISEELFKKLVDGATVRKDLAIYLRDKGATGFDNPDHTSLKNFTSHYQGKESHITDLNNSLNDETKNTKKALTALDSLKVTVADNKADCQAEQKVQEQAIKDAVKREGDATGLYESMKGRRDAIKITLDDTKIELTGVQEDLKACKSGNVTDSAIVKLIKNILGLFKRRNTNDVG